MNIKDIPTITISKTEVEELLASVKARHRSISAGRFAEEKLCAMLAQFAADEAPDEATKPVKPSKKDAQ